MQKIKPVILCGGSGTRLWPLSRKALPKQFVPLIDNKSLLQLTLERLKLLSDEVVCVASEEHRFLVAEAIEGAGVVGMQILEPVGRNTAAAMAVAALNAKPEDLLLFCPADHHIPDAAAFAPTIQSGVASAQQGYIVTFGVLPTFPSTAYGYIQQGESLGQGAANQVARFLEKPSAEVAQQLLLAGGYYWNAGIFLVQAQILIATLQAHAPDILQAARKSVSTQIIDGKFVRLGREDFEACRSESIDYAVLEKHSQVAVVPFSSAWSDVGSWNAVADLYSSDESGNRIQGRGFAFGASNTFIYAQDRPVVALGTEDLLIIDTTDALLVATRSHAEKVKDIVASLDAQGVAQATQHRRVGRPWGTYDNVDIGERFKVKRIFVNPGAKLSLQMHYHRAEHWIVVKGTAKVTRGDDEFLLSENESTYIPLGVTHRLENPGKTPLEIIEVQSGSYLGEDDIVRFEDTYGRVVPLNIKHTNKASTN